MEEVVRAPVGIGVHQDGAAGLAVAAGAAYLLVIAFEAGGQRGVDDRAHVGLVDAHSEGDGGDDDFEASFEKLALDALAGLRVESSMIGGAGKGAGQLGSRRLSLFARGRVDDGWAALAGLGGARG